MPAMNMRELRDTRKLKELLRQGKSVELRDRNKVIGKIVPETAAAAPAEWPNFEAELNTIFGNKVLHAVDDFLEDRHRR